MSNSTKASAKAPLPFITRQRIAAAQVTYGTGENPFALLHEILREEEIAFYQKGITMRASPAVLKRDAERKTNHSEILNRNMRAARPAEAQPPQTATHHIVARADYRANQSRATLFQWGVGINDADNGCWLPMMKTSCVPCMPNAVSHSGLHTSKYHLKVTLRLLDAKSTETVREYLCAIKGELVDGTFV